MRKREIVLIAVIVLIDLLTKSWSEAAIGLGNQQVIIENFFSITIARNTGAAWSVFEGEMTFFYIMTIIALAVMFYGLFSAKKINWLFRISLCLMIAGTLGNFFDRLTLHYVRDFLDFIIFGYDYPIFNVADISLCIGVFLMIIDVFFDSKGEKANG